MPGRAICRRHFYHQPEGDDYRVR